MLTPSRSRSSQFLESFETTGYSPGAQQGSAQASGIRPGANDQNRIKPSSRWSPAPPGGYGSGGGGGRSTGISTTRTKTVRKGEAPEMPQLPTFKAPELDKRAVKALSQKMAAPGIRTLRQTMQQAMGKNYENPNVRKMTLREALQGYGTGLEKVMAGASREARSEKMAELDLQRQQEVMNFQAQSNAAMQSYQNAWQDYLKGEETVSTTTPTTEEGTRPGGVKMGSRTFYQTRSPFTGAVAPL